MILTLLVIIAVLIVIVYLGVNKHTQTPDTPRCKHRDCFTRRNQHERKGAGWPCTRPIKIKNATKGKMKRTQLVDYPESSDSDFEIVQPKKKVKGLSEVQELRGLMKQQDRISAALGRPVPDTPAPSGSGIYADDGEVASSSKIYVPSPPREIFYPNELRGQVDDCYCKVEDVDNTHSVSFEPLSKLVQRNYFRYYKVNLDKPCIFWKERGECTRSTCALKTCTQAEVPVGLADNNNKSSGPTCEEEQELSKINNVISDDRIAALQKLEKHEADNINFCVQEDEDSEKAEFYDLLQNPERYTGYSGEPARRIWRSIYEENCFKPKKDSLFIDLTHKSINYMCKEKRVFFRVVSGLHSSISIHLAAKYPVQDFFGQKWGPNLAEFSRRFLPESTNGEGPHWLKNLYFVYLVEMRAITKALPLWKSWDFYTGNPEEDTKTKEDVVDIVESLLSCPDTFDEAQLFKGPAAGEILNDFLVHFRNISQIMDCVTCDKCRLWGKIQIRGLGTALKILFSGGKPENLALERGEVVTLFNAFNQLSHSLHYVKQFKDQMDYSQYAGPPEESDRKQDNIFSTFSRGEL